MDTDTTPRLAGGAAFVVAGIAVMLIGAPGLLGVLLILAGMVLLGLVVTGHESVPALLRSRGVGGRRRRPRD
ncbi:hypothetical protein AB0L40_16595 [Patulibacter sp. NPDC049589]|uniref:hypothetical protein n=1 Tax=Patulibacter sp. NPDC049589 TaxID=3154731 RepID=UPI0034439E68